MDALTDYLQGEYVDDRAAIDGLRQLAGEALRTLVATARRPEIDWPRELVDGSPPPAAPTGPRGRLVIVGALAALAGRMPFGALGGSVLGGAGAAGLEAGELEAVVDAGIDGVLADALTSFRARGVLVDDPAYGADDPFALAILLLLARSAPAEPELDAALSGAARETVERAFADPGRPLLRIAAPDGDVGVAHALPLLNAVQVHLALGGEPVSTAVVRAHVDAQVHRALSLRAMDDSGFDPAELAFFLEAAVLLHPVAPDTAPLAATLSGWEGAAAATARWRPSRPLRASPDGMVLVPQAVEAFNSLLRTVAMLDGDDDEWFARAAPLLGAFAARLEARMLRAGDGSFAGWESDHTFTGDRIHPVPTAQAVGFLLGYAALRQRHVAARAMRAARFLPRGLRRSAPGAVAQWDRWCAGEPMLGLRAASPYRVYDAIAADFVAPRADGAVAADAPASMLLYGPPGTGKTTVAEELARALGHRLVVVTPSDFITAGTEGVEARAKAIFQTLEEQSGLVVLFDEVDQLLLDRDSDLYRTQGDLFKLMTPGMLTKVNRLTRRRANVYVIATNYYDRIDSAIKRPGRIDARYLVLPPDRAQRERFLATLPGWEGAPAARRDDVLDGTALYTFKELMEIAGVARRRADGKGGAALVDALDAARVEVRPIIRIDSYRGRVEGGGERPLEEFALCVHLALESGRPLDRFDGWVHAAVRDALAADAVRDDAVVAALAGATTGAAAAAR